MDANLQLFFQLSTITSKLLSSKIYIKGMFHKFEYRNQSYIFHLRSLYRAFTPSYRFYFSHDARIVIKAPNLKCSIMQVPRSN